MYSNIISKYRDKYSRDNDIDNDNEIFNAAYKNNYNPIITKYIIIRRCRYRHILFKDDYDTILGKKRKYDDAFN
jgi:hypothetical protein